MEFNVKEFSNYSQFGNVESMDEVIYEYKNRLEADRVATSVIELLLYLGSQSLVVPGVSWKKQATIATALGYGVKTVYNGLKKLAEYEMIAKEATTSNWKTSEGGAKKRRGVDIIVIQAYLPSMITEHDYAPTEAEETAPAKAKEDLNNSEPCSFNQSFISSSNTLLETGKAAAARVKTSSLRQSIPTAIYEALAPFYDVDGLYKAYGTLLRAKAAIDRTITIEEHGQAYIDAFMNVVRKYKLGEVRSMNGLLFVAWKQLTEEISRRGSSKAGIFEAIMATN